MGGLSLVGGEERKVGWTTEGRIVEVTIAPGVGRAWILLLLKLSRDNMGSSVGM